MNPNISDSGKRRIWTNRRLMTRGNKVTAGLGKRRGPHCPHAVILMTIPNQMTMRHWETTQEASHTQFFIQ